MSDAVYDRWLRVMERIGLTATRNYNFDDKQACIDNYIIYMLDRMSSMFEWQGLPDTIPERSLELYLKLNGNCCIAEHEGDLYAFIGGRGGEPDVYYMPTQYTVANPALRLSKVYTIDTDCVVIPNDTMYRGLLPLLERYASLMTETELSQNIAIINTRIMSLISAPDDQTRESALAYLEEVKQGKLGVIADNAFLEGVKAQPYGSATTNYLTNIIETMQYVKASFFNEIGLNANYNMKREAINSDESQMNNDALLPLIDDMLKQRREACERINAMFGTNISVDFASAWEDNIEELEAEQAALESESEVAESESDPDTTDEEDEEDVSDEET